MKTLGRALIVLAAGLLSGLALVASAAGTTATHGKQVRHLQLPVGALAVDGDRVAYDLSSRDAAGSSAVNKVLVWNVRTGKTIKVSGKKTAVADDTGTGAGVFQLAIAGSRVAWLVNEGGNLEATDYLFTSSVTQPKERQVASALRSGDGGCSGREPTGCTGAWLGGLVGSGTTIALNRWTTDAVGHMGSGGLYAVNGTQTKSIASGTDTVSAVSEDGGREAVLRSDGSVAVYAKSGSVQTTVNPPSALGVALSGKNLVVLSKGRKLELYDAHTGSLRKTLSTHGKGGPQNLDVQGNIATYASNSSVHAVNLSSGKDRTVGTLGNRIAFARIDSAGLAYAANGTRASFGKSTLVFEPLARIKAAVS
jgi:WD40 repeat protein